MVDTIAQYGILVFGVGSILLMSLKNKWGTVAGLLSQPFWFATAIAHEQWGILAVNCVYLVVWIIGFYNWFFRKTKTE